MSPSAPSRSGHQRPMRGPVPTFEPGDIVKIPVPYTNRPTPQFRPALVVSDGSGNEPLSLLWVVMITSAENRGWAGDVAVGDLPGTGLPVPSFIRTAKIATIEARDPIPFGQVAPDVRAGFLARIAERLGMSL